MQARSPSHPANAGTAVPAMARLNSVVPPTLRTAAAEASNAAGAGAALGIANATIHRGASGRMMGLILG
jgi:hypothetical protein